MNVLIACEYSGAVRDAFIAKGHDAISCDLLPTDQPGPHIIGDCVPVIKQGWDLIIMHPPCTALAVSGNRWYGEGMPLNLERKKSIEWTLHLWESAKANADRVCMENPVGVLTHYIGKPQYIQPWQFGHGETKKTGLWLHNLPQLNPTKIVDGREQRVWKLPPSQDRWKIRSTTYQGVAKAMAEQWG